MNICSYVLYVHVYICICLSMQDMQMCSIYASATSSWCLGSVLYSCGWWPVVLDHVRIGQGPFTRLSTPRSGSRRGSWCCWIELLRGDISHLVWEHQEELEDVAEDGGRLVFRLHVLNMLNSVKSATSFTKVSL